MARASALERRRQARSCSKRCPIGEDVSPAFSPRLPERRMQDKDHLRFVPSFSVLEPPGLKGQDVVTENPGRGTHIPVLRPLPPEMPGWSFSPRHRGMEGSTLDERPQERTVCTHPTNNPLPKKQGALCGPPSAPTVTESNHPLEMGSVL